MRRRIPVIIIGFTLLLVAAAACSGSESSIGDRLVVTQGIFRSIPLTLKDAEAQGWVNTQDCVPQMGIHALKMAGNQPEPLVALYNSDGQLIGVELESVAEQPAPPWEHLPEGHPGMEFEHWTLHMYFSDPAAACG